MHLRQQQPRRLSRAAGKLCRKHAWNARSEQRHVPDAKQVLLWKGWLLKQRLHDVQSCVGATATRAHVESPLCKEFFADSCSVRHQGNCCASTREIPATWISIRTQGAARCSCEKIAALARHKHTWISLRAQRDKFRREDCCVLALRAHLDLAPCAKRHVPSKKLLRSHAASTLGSLSVRKQELRTHVHATDCCIRTPLRTLGSLSVRKEACSGRVFAAFSRCEHTWISLRAQRDMFHRKDCWDLALPPR